MDIAQIIVEAGLANTKSQARRLIEQKAISFNQGTDKQVTVHDKFCQIFFVNDTWLMLSDNANKLTVLKQC